MNYFLIVDSKEVMDNMEDLDFRIKILILLILSLARIRNSAWINKILHFTNTTLYMGNYNIFFCLKWEFFLFNENSDQKVSEILIVLANLEMGRFRDCYHIYMSKRLTILCLFLKHKMDRIDISL